MKKISLFISLTLFAFSFSINLIEKSLKINFVGKGILGSKELQELLKEKLRVSNKDSQKTINEMIEDIIYPDKMAWNNVDLQHNPGKNIRIKKMCFLTNLLNGDKKYIQFIAYDYEAVFVAPPIIKRKCTTFLFIKNCKNVKVEQTITQKELEDYIDKLIYPKIYNRAQLFLPKENNSKFYEIYKKNFPLKFN